MNYRTICLVAGLGLFLFAHKICAAESLDNTDEVQQLLDDLVAAYKTKDIPSIMSAYLPDERLVVFDVTPPYKFVGARAYRQFFADFYAEFPGPIDVVATQRSITRNGDFAFAHETDTWNVTSKDGERTSMATLETYVFQKIQGRWFIVHEHASVPADTSASTAQPRQP